MATDYGRDVAMVFIAGGAGADLDPTFALVTGQRAVAEAVARRLLSRRASLINDLDYGLDVRVVLGEALGPAARFAFERAIAAEAMKDERVLDASCSVAVDASGGVDVDLVLTTDEGEFRLVLDVGQVTTIALSEV
jgi:hypothetical protein